MGGKKRKNRKAEAHGLKAPLSNHGESKPLIIAVVTIVAVLALSLFLFFSSRFVGKAVSFGQLNVDEAGITLTDNTISQGESVVIPVKVNIGEKKSSVLSFAMKYDKSKFDIDCGKISAPLDKIFTNPNLVVLKEVSCDDGLVSFKYAALPSPDEKKYITGNMTIAELTLNAKADAKGVSTLDFTNFEVYSLDDGKKMEGLNILSPDVEVVLVEDLCGNGVINDLEECDLGKDKNGKSDQSCSDACKSWTCKDLGNGHVQMTYNNDVVKDLKAECKDESAVNYGCFDDNNKLVSTSNKYGFLSAKTCPKFNQVCSLTSKGAECVDKTQTCAPNSKICEGDKAWKQCNDAGTGYEDPVSCDSDEVCDKGACAAKPAGCTSNTDCPANQVCDNNVCVTSGLTPPGVQGTKISLLELPLAGNMIQTRITALEDFNVELTSYTVLKNKDGKVLVLKTEKIPAMKKFDTYILSVVYAKLSDVEEKSVIVQDKLPDQGWTVHGELVTKPKTS